MGEELCLDGLAVDRDIDIGRIRVQALTDHQAGLAMCIHTAADERHIRREGKIALSFLPGKVKGIAVEPHVRSAA